MLKGSNNKGDWSEFYALVYLLGLQKVYASDKHLKRLLNYYFPILKIYRDEKTTSSNTKHMEYVVQDENTIGIYEDGNLLGTIGSQELLDAAEHLKTDILSASGNQIDIPHGEKLLNRLGLTRLSVPSNNINDLLMEIHDTHVGIDQKMGFSVKSYMGGAPTLLNASSATNFIFKVHGITDAQMDEINAIDSASKIQDRMQKIYSYGGQLEFAKTASDIFAGNLMMIDSNMDRIIAEMLLLFFCSSGKKCADIVAKLEEDNPLHYPRKGLYEYKFKEFLCAKALGMEPGSFWNGLGDANGGYIVVKSDGDVVAFHIYDRDIFKQYLLDNTRFEKGSITKHKYASLYKENDEIFIKLNLQIRFI